MLCHHFRILFRDCDHELEVAVQATILQIHTYQEDMANFVIDARVGNIQTVIKADLFADGTGLSHDLYVPF